MSTTSEKGRRRIPAAAWRGTPTDSQIPQQAVTAVEEAPQPGDSFRHIAPLGANSWQGRSAKKPHDYRVTVALPHINTLEPLRVCVDVLRAQTERPYIMIVDTGSSPEVREQLEAMRAEDLEIHYIAAHGYRHASEPVAVALDLAQTLCRTDLLLHTHTDCFLRRHDAIETLARMTDELTPVVGYRMSPRDWVTQDWEWMTGHTILMLYMPIIHRAGATWSFSRMRDAYGFDFKNKGGWPDTETGFNYALREAGIQPLFIGYDRNYERQVDDWMDHARSYPGSKLTHPEYHERAKGWMENAITEARARLETWKK